MEYFGTTRSSGAGLSSSYLPVFQTGISSCLLAIFAGALLAGCVASEATTLSSAPSDRPAVKEADVQLYSDTSSVECSYERVAYISIEGSMSSISDQQMIDTAKKKAAEVRANAVIIGRLATDKPGGFENDTGGRSGRFLALLENRPC